MHLSFQPVGLGIWISAVGLRVDSLGFSFHVWGLGFRVYPFGTQLEVSLPRNKISCSGGVSRSGRETPMPPKMPYIMSRIRHNFTVD